MKRRFSLAELLAIVAVAALGLAAMRDGSRMSLLITYSLAMGSLFVATLAALVRAKPLGAWVGFAVFGWGSYLVTCVPALNPNDAQTPVNELTEAVVDWLQPMPAVPNEVANSPRGLVTPWDVAQSMEFEASVKEAELPPAVSSYLSKFRARFVKLNNARAIARLIACLLIALAGSLIGRFLASRREPAPPAP